MTSKQEKMKKLKEWKSYSVEILLNGAKASYSEDGVLLIEGKLGQVFKKLVFPNVSFKISEEKVEIFTKKFTQRVKKILHTFRAHVKNMVLGVSEGFEYNLAIVYEKFPMKVELKSDMFVVKDFLGEKVPRSFQVLKDVKVDIKGKDIKVSGINKESVGQVAARIEQLCRITHLDRRVIQDGIYITKKPHRSYI